MREVVEKTIDIYLYMKVDKRSARMRSDFVKNMSACADQNHAPSLTEVRLEKIGNSKKFPISQKAHSLL